MDYFCYISRTKVDQLFQNISSEVDEWVEKQTTEHDIGAEVGADFSIGGILRLFKGGISYGRKGMVQRERKVKLQYVDKLRRVLLAIAKEQTIKPIENAVASSAFDSLYWHHQGVFRIVSKLDADGGGIRSNQVVTLRTTVLSRTLDLDCSLRFFSDGNEPDGTFLLHSSNRGFFAGSFSLRLETVFVLLNHNEETLFGSPLFLKLVADEVSAHISI